ncbi:MAG: hypothetical protein NTZ74_12965 [Chloroflexi bacterium]|nr:hypothetical protein [Chloroflexota bacterium]
MIRHKLFYTLLVFTLAILPSCNAQPTPEYVPEGPERDSILADSNGFARNLQEGMEKKDFELFSRNFDNGMLNAVTNTTFEEIYKRYENSGPRSGLDLINVQVAGDYYAVRYKVTYAKKVVIMRVVVTKTTPRKISGLWFE